MLENFLATAATLTTATLSWDWPASAMAFQVRYQAVDRSGAALGALVVAAADLGGNETTVTGLAALASYRFSVSGRNKHLAGYLRFSYLNLTMEGPGCGPYVGCARWNGLGPTRNERGRMCACAHSPVGLVTGSWGGRLRHRRARASAWILSGRFDMAATCRCRLDIPDVPFIF